jgi:hypothetical protein
MYASQPLNELPAPYLPNSKEVPYTQKAYQEVPVGKEGISSQVVPHTAEAGTDKNPEVPVLPVLSNKRHRGTMSLCSDHVFLIPSYSPQKAKPWKISEIHVNST